MSEIEIKDLMIEGYKILKEYIDKEDWETAGIICADMRNLCIAKTKMIKINLPSRQDSDQADHQEGKN